MKLFRFSKLSLIGVIGLAIGATAAQTPKPSVAHVPKLPAQQIDVKDLSKKIENVVVPLPNEVFGALDKLGTVNWHDFVRTNKGTNFTERPRIALLLGTVIADGFIAVEAQDVPAVKDIGQRVQKLASAIGVERSITQHAKAITEFADKKKWDNVRQELDRTQNSVQQAMNEVHDEKLSQLVSLGGWLRGTQVLTAVVTKDFKPDGAELLHQPDLVVHFETQLEGMPEYNVPIVKEIQTALGEVKPMIDVGNARISAESVRKINQITTRLDSGIVTKE